MGRPHNRSTIVNSESHMFAEQRCERCSRRPATQADTYLNEWQCDDCYSAIGRATDDYQAPDIDWDALELSAGIFPQIAGLSSTEE